MKTLWLIPSFWPMRGGIETVGRHLAEGLRIHGQDLVIVTDEGQPPAPPAELLDGLRIIRLPIYQALSKPNPAQLLHIQRKLAELAAEYQADLLHLHLVGATPMGAFALRLQQITAVPLLVTVHDDLRRARVGSNTLLGQCLTTAAWVTTDSQHFLDDVILIQPGLASRSSVIPPGLPPLATTPQPLNAATTQFLALGRLVPEKGFDLALTALADVTQDIPAAQLTVAGSGPMLDPLQSQAAALGLGEKVHFVGAVTDAERTQLIESSLALLMPSRHREGFGLVALEAAQHGRAVIAAQAGALVDTVKQLGNGLLIPQEDSAALSAAMLRLLTEPGLAQALGKNGQAAAAQQFSQDQYTTRYLALMHQLTAPRWSS